MSAGDELYHGPSQGQVEALRDLATKLRVASVKMTQASKSGHPTSCSSMAELMSVLFFRVMKYKDPRVHKEQRDPANDRFVPVLDYITPSPCQVCALQGSRGSHPVRGLGRGRPVPCRGAAEPEED